MPLSQIPYRAADVGKLYNARTDLFMRAGAQTSLPPAAEDDFHTLLLLIDMQVDFVHSRGSLSIPGAIEDTQRLIEFIYKYLGQITKITASLDTHSPWMIFFPSWWVDPNTGKSPKPFTVISSLDILNKHWVPLYDTEWSKHYVLKSEESGSPLIIWPYHTIENTGGHLLVPALSEALTFHGQARLTEPCFYRKGDTPQTEHYGIFAPEVPYPQNYFSEEAAVFAREVACHDRIIVAGQAKSHCVLRTLEQMTGPYFHSNILHKVTLLTDCTSSVSHPDNLFENQAVEKLAQLQKQGLTLATSTTLAF